LAFKLKTILLKETKNNIVKPVVTNPNKPEQILQTPLPLLVAEDKRQENQSQSSNPGRLSTRLDYLLKNWWFWSLVGLTLITALTRLLTLGNYVDSPDGFLFRDGVERYSVIETRPHWPGYPVYMWVGKLFNVALNDAGLALRLLSTAFRRKGT
jgi:hypothetical protein